MVSNQKRVVGINVGHAKNAFLFIRRWFIARIDHRPLVAMMKNKLNVMMEGWMDVILKFNFSVEYLPGEDNEFADALSRCHDHLGSFLTVQTAKVKITSADTDQTMAWKATKRGKQIPSEKERGILVEKAHLLGHFSVEAMFRKLWNDGYWWPAMRSDLKKHVQACLNCLRYNITQEGFHPLQSVEADQPWDHIEIDLIGPYQYQQKDTHIY